MSYQNVRDSQTMLDGLARGLGFQEGLLEVQYKHHHFKIPRGQ